MEAKLLSDWTVEGPDIYGKNGDLDIRICMVSLLARRPKEQPSYTEKQSQQHEKERCEIARLIAAAPLMYEACKDIETCIRMTLNDRAFGGKEKRSMYLKQLQAAIAAAEKGE